MNFIFMTITIMSTMTNMTITMLFVMVIVGSW